MTDEHAENVERLRSQADGRAVFEQDPIAGVQHEGPELVLAPILLIHKRHEISIRNR